MDPVIPKSTSGSPAYGCLLLLPLLAPWPLGVRGAGAAVAWCGVELESISQACVPTAPVYPPRVYRHQDIKDSTAIYKKYSWNGHTCFFCTIYIQHIISINTVHSSLKNPPARSLTRHLPWPRSRLLTPPSPCYGCPAVRIRPLLPFIVGLQLLPVLVRVWGCADVVVVGVCV